MITNKDIRVENGFLIINGDKFPLDGQSPETIMEIVEDNSDSTPTENSTAPVTSGGVYTALGTKQDTLTFDSAPTDASTNPVTSAGIKTYVDIAIGDLTQTGVTGADVAAQLETLDGKITALPVIVSGQADFQPAAIGSQDIEVQFPSGVFTSAPIVTATMSDTTPFNVGSYMEADLYVYNVTKDSFFLRGTRKNASYTWKANWIAVQM